MKKIIAFLIPVYLVCFVFLYTPIGMTQDMLIAEVDDLEDSPAEIRLIGKLIKNENDFFEVLGYRLVGTFDFAEYENEYVSIEGTLIEDGISDYQSINVISLSIMEVNDNISATPTPPNSGEENVMFTVTGVLEYDDNVYQIGEYEFIDSFGFGYDLQKDVGKRVRITGEIFNNTDGEEVIRVHEYEVVDTKDKSIAEIILNRDERMKSIGKPREGVIEIENKVDYDVTGTIAKGEIDQNLIASTMEEIEKGLLEYYDLSINVPKSVNVNEIVQNVPAEFITGKFNGNVEITTEKLIVSLPSNMFDKSIAEKKYVSESNELIIDDSSKIEISLKDALDIPDNLKGEIEERPVFDINISIDGQPVKWENNKHPVVISIPYDLAPEEIDDYEHIVVFYIDETGKSTPIPGGKYDMQSKSVVFPAVHFSKYGIAFSKKTFVDIYKTEWARNQIEVLASRGIISGTSENTYEPEMPIKRADFVIMLVKALGLYCEFDSSFSDVYSTDYFYKYVSIAKELGIVYGTGDNKFEPLSYITRQDMMVITERALTLIGKTKENETTIDLTEFKDEHLISEYAKKSIRILVSEGIIVGDGDYIRPLEVTSRAEMATVVYKIIEM